MYIWKYNNNEKKKSGLKSSVFVKTTQRVLL